MCPHCGASFPEGRLACPECGSDAETGWKSSEEIDYLSVELPEWEGREEREGRGPAGPLAWLLFWALLAFLVLALVL